MTIRPRLMLGQRGPFQVTCAVKRVSHEGHTRARCKHPCLKAPPLLGVHTFLSGLTPKIIQQEEGKGPTLAEETTFERVEDPVTLVRRPVFSL